LKNDCTKYFPNVPFFPIRIGIFRYNEVFNNNTMGTNTDIICSAIRNSKTSETFKESSIFFALNNLWSLEEKKSQHDKTQKSTENKDNGAALKKKWNEFVQFQCNLVALFCWEKEIMVFSYSWKRCAAIWTPFVG
jgi:hypothetical protein